MNTEYGKVIDREIDRLNADTGREWTFGTTGGNCSAYFSNEPNGDYYMITCEASAPIDAEEWEEATLGFYSEANGYDPEGYTEGNRAEIVEFFTNNGGK